MLTSVVIDGFDFYLIGCSTMKVHPQRGTNVRAAHAGGHAYRGAPSLPAAKRGPRVALRSIACPDCPAGVDEPCLNTAGVPKNAVHAARRRLATRAANLARAAAAAAELTDPPAPKVTGQGGGPVVDCPSCGCLVALSPATVLGRRRDLMVPNHQPGGGGWSARGKGSRCPSSQEILNSDLP